MPGVVVLARGLFDMTLTEKLLQRVSRRRFKSAGYLGAAHRIKVLRHHQLPSHETDGFSVVCFHSFCQA